MIFFRGKIQMIFSKATLRPDLKPALSCSDNKTAHDRFPQLLLVSPHHGHCLPPLLLSSLLSDQADGKQVAGASLGGLHKQGFKSRSQPISPPGEHAAIVGVTNVAEDDAENIGGQRGSICTLHHLLHLPQQPASNAKG